MRRMWTSSPGWPVSGLVFLIGSRTMPGQHNRLRLCWVKVYASLTLTCHLHFWQTDRDLVGATAVTGGGNRDRVRVSIDSRLWRRNFSRRWAVSLSGGLSLRHISIYYVACRVLCNGGLSLRHISIYYLACRVLCNVGHSYTRPIFSWRLS